MCKRYSTVIVVVANKIDSRAGLDVKNIIAQREGLCHAYLRDLRGNV